MTKYKIYTKGNYLVIVDTQKNEYFYGIRKEVHVDKSNVNKEVYRAFNVKDFSDTINLQIPNILKEDNSPYTEAEFDTFYQENTGNFNGGGTAPTGVESVTGDSVDNIDPLNPIINAIPLTGTTTGNPVTGDIEILPYNGTGKIIASDGTIQSYIKVDYDLDGGGGGLVYIKDGFETVFMWGQDRIRVQSDFPNFIGLSGSSDYSGNITDLDYIQKIYVDTYTQRTTATSGTVNIDSGKRDLVFIHEAGATTTLTLNLPTSPKNNQKVTIMSVGGIVGLTLATAVGTIIGAVTTLASLGTTKLIWNSSQSKWYKIS